ncbi:MAG: hypothetical protein COA58_00705 [Bacteroidetes bacterium]|nr:MAG: hypothetical protein COA58_00705 [Bacteroidota bacterium]
MRIILILFLTVLVSTSYGQKTKCQDFKNGNFIILSDNGSKTIITRKGKTQTEQIVGTDDKMSLKVHWIDDCTYTLKMKKSLSYFLQPKEIRNMVIVAHITKTTANSYLLDVSSNVMDLVIKMELIRVKP